MSEIKEGDTIEVLLEVEVLEVFPDDDLMVDADGTEFMVRRKEVFNK